MLVLLSWNLLHPSAPRQHREKKDQGGEQKCACKEEAICKSGDEKILKMLK